MFKVDQAEKQLIVALFHPSDPIFLEPPRFFDKLEFHISNSYYIYFPPAEVTEEDSVSPIPYYLVATNDLLFIDECKPLPVQRVYPPRCSPTAQITLTDLPTDPTSLLMEEGMEHLKSQQIWQIEEEIISAGTVAPETSVKSPQLKAASTNGTILESTIGGVWSVQASSNGMLNPLLRVMPLVQMVPPPTTKAKVKRRRRTPLKTKEVLKEEGTSGKKCRR